MAPKTVREEALRQGGAAAGGPRGAGAVQFRRRARAAPLTSNRIATHAQLDRGREIGQNRDNA